MKMGSEVNENSDLQTVSDSDSFKKQMEIKGYRRMEQHYGESEPRKNFVGHGWLYFFQDGRFEYAHNKGKWGLIERQNTKIRGINNGENTLREQGIIAALIKVTVAIKTNFYKFYKFLNEHNFFLDSTSRAFGELCSL